MAIQFLKHFYAFCFANMVVFYSCAVLAVFLGGKLLNLAVRPGPFNDRFVDGVQSALLVVALSVGVASAILYIVTPCYADHVAPQVSSISALWLRGGPVYHARNAAVAYGGQYGPLLYLCSAAGLAAFGMTMFSGTGPILFYC